MIKFPKANVSLNSEKSCVHYIYLSAMFDNPNIYNIPASRGGVVLTLHHSVQSVSHCSPLSHWPHIYPFFFPYLKYYSLHMHMYAISTALSSLFLLTSSHSRSHISASHLHAFEPLRSTLHPHSRLSSHSRVSHYMYRKHNESLMTVHRNLDLHINYMNLRWLPWVTLAITAAGRITGEHWTYLRDKMPRRPEYSEDFKSVLKSYNIVTHLHTHTH